MGKVTVRVFRGDVNGGELVPYEVETFQGMVLLDAIHQIQDLGRVDIHSDGSQKPPEEHHVAQEMAVCGLHDFCSVIHDT